MSDSIAQLLKTRETYRKLNCHSDIRYTLSYILCENMKQTKNNTFNIINISTNTQKAYPC